MALDPTLSLKVLNPLDAQSAALDNQVKQARIDDMPRQIQMENEKFQMEKDRFAFDKKRAELEDQFKKAEYSGRLLGMATPQNYAQLRMQAINQLGADPASIPEVYDEGFIRQASMATLDAKDRLGYELDKMKTQADVALKGAQLKSEYYDMEATKALTGQRLSAIDLNQANTQKVRSGGSEKPLPVQAVKLQDEALDTIGTINGLNADVNTVRNLIKSGDLKLGPVQNLKSNLKNMSGFSDYNSQNYQTLDATIEKIRNDTLRLNKGVQTEGDAVRALNELLKNKNDPKVVEQQLKRIENINKRAVDMRKKKLDLVRQNYGAQPLDYSAFEGESAVQAAPKQTDYKNKYGLE